MLIEEIAAFYLPIFQLLILNPDLAAFRFWALNLNKQKSAIANWKSAISNQQSTVLSGPFDTLHPPFYDHLTCLPSNL
ncbi:MAG: hypothetical protein C5B55_07885 [Blastocatellia bacterium]|nr:MAG: hypothetical protein C5B55_07885 [Blastocatellia bacterium]